MGGLFYNLYPLKLTLVHGACCLLPFTLKGFPDFFSNVCFRRLDRGSPMCGDLKMWSPWSVGPSFEAVNGGGWGESGMGSRARAPRRCGAHPMGPNCIGPLAFDCGLEFVVLWVQWCTPSFGWFSWLVWSRWVGKEDWAPPLHALNHYFRVGPVSRYGGPLCSLVLHTNWFLIPHCRR